MGDGPIKMTLNDWLYYWQDRVTYWIVWRLMPRFVATERPAAGEPAP